MSSGPPRSASPPSPPSRRRRQLASTRPGILPGALPAAADGARSGLRVMAFDEASVSERETRVVEEALAAVRPDGVTWINVDGAGDARTLAQLGERFGLHPLALEDAMSGLHRPKAERYETYFFVVLRMLRGTREVEEEQVSVFFGPGWVITIQERADGDVFDPVREAIRHERGRVRTAGADYLAYLLLDAVVDGYYPVLEAVADRLDALQEAALTRPTRETLEGIQHLRHDVLAIRRAVWPVREELGVLQRDESGLITAETKVFLRDAYDHAVQALDVVESLREGVASAMEVYLSAQNQRLNEVMKVLTVIATLFIPLTFIASIYGMNFEVMPELTWRYGYAWALGLMLLSAVAMVAYFRRRGWW